jgi:hypothetical protein
MERSLINTIKNENEKNSNCIILAFVTIVGVLKNKTNPQEKLKESCCSKRFQI